MLTLVIVRTTLCYAETVVRCHSVVTMTSAAVNGAWQLRRTQLLITSQKMHQRANPGCGCSLYLSPASGEILQSHYRPLRCRAASSHHFYVL